MEKMVARSEIFLVELEPGGLSQPLVSIAPWVLQLGDLSGKNLLARFALPTGLSHGGLERHYKLSMVTGKSLWGKETEIATHQPSPKCKVNNQTRLQPGSIQATLPKAFCPAQRA